MKTKRCNHWVGGAVAAMLCLGGPGFNLNAQDQPLAPAGTDSAAALPPGVDPSSPLAEVIRLAQSGVSESVIMSYVNNSTSLFNLNADQIIYLKDLGVPDGVVTAMIQHDQTLQQQAATPPPPAPAGTTVVEAAAPPTDAVTVDYFYNTLSPYGAWVEVEGYGRCWRPTVVVYDAGWSPYCDHGHWIWTDDGWYWISDYSWGWAPFHYGRWFRDARFGWCWHPDTVWGPSWVTWRYGDGYCGWAPLPPRCVYREGVGLFYNGVAVGVDFDFGLDVSMFAFVPTRNFCDPQPWRYRVPPHDAPQFFRQTAPINNFNGDGREHPFVNRGIDPGKITEVTHRDIRPVTIRDTNERLPRGQQLGRDGQTLMVNRPHSGGNPGEAPHRASSSPVVGNPNQPGHGANDNHNPSSPGRSQPTPTPGPGHYPVTPPTGHSTAPVYHAAPVTPVQPSAPNVNAPDSRRYTSPRMQQSGQQTPRATSSKDGSKTAAPATSQTPANSSQGNRSSSPGGYAQPSSPGNQSHGENASSPARGQSQGQGNSRGKGQNGQ